MTDLLHATLRIRRYRQSRLAGKKYEGSFEVLDEATGQVLAGCDLFGKAVFATLEIQDDRQRSWQMRPNRKILPSRWILTDPSQGVFFQFDQKVLGKLTNPLYRVVLAILDASDQEQYRLVDPASNILDRMLNVDPSEWAIMQADRPVAKLVHLPKIAPEETKNLVDKFRTFLAGSDRGPNSNIGSRCDVATVNLGQWVPVRRVPT